ncbi:MAG: M48 family metalloprotease [Bacteroidota bacterium]
MKNASLIFFVFASFQLLQSCARNPVTGKKQVVLMSEAQEIAMGQEADPQIVAQFGLYPDSALQRFIRQKGQEMVAISHRPNIKYEFKILDSDVLNAFATPGGYVYFTRGIMAHFNDEAQFAGVLGHETGHITARHSVAQQRNAILGQIGIIAGVVIEPRLAQFAETASQGLQLLFLKYGRDDEKQADELGVEYSSKVGYDAKQMADFFLTLKRQSESSGAEALPEFLSTHPDPGNRYTKVNQMAAEWKSKLNLTKAIINRNSYLQRIDGIVYGEDPRQGFLENSVFYHPELKFQFPTPRGWNYQNTPQRVQMAPKDGKALLMLMTAPGKSLQEAATNLLQQNNLTALQSDQITINGLPAVMIVADSKQDPQSQQQQQPIRTLSYLIQYNNLIYLILGLSTQQDFSTYAPYFTSAGEGFSILTDQRKINKKPQRVQIKTVNTNTTLEQALKNYAVTAARMNELAILNGMKLTDKLTPGTMIKVISE